MSIDHPGPSADHTQAIIAAYSGQMFDAWAKQPLRLAEHERRLVETFCPARDLRILNLGCGAGRETFALHELGYRNLTGVDCTSALLAQARAHRDARNLALQFDEATAEKLPYPDNSFDAATLFENLYGHITPRAARLRALHEIARVLRPGGLVLLEATSLRNAVRYRLYHFAANGVRRLYNPAEMEPGDKRLRAAQLTRSQSPRALARSHWFEPDEVPAEARAAGLEVVLATTVRQVNAGNTSATAAYRHAGRLVYVLRTALRPPG